MGINVNMDYSALFSSMSGSSSASSNNYLSNLSGLLSDYSSIKNGSYGKLVSAYYKKIEGDDSSSSSSKKTDKTDTEKEQSKKAEKKQYASMVNTAKELQSDAEKLTNKSAGSIYEKEWLDSTDEDGNETKVYDYNSSKIISAVSDFVKNYNSLVTSASNASDTTTSTRASQMSKIASSYEDELAQIGITVKDNGKLSIDKEKMKDAGMESVRNVMGSRSGFAYQISSSASLIENAAGNVSSGKNTYSSSGTMNTDISSIMDSFV